LEERKECSRSNENGVKLYLLISVQDINRVSQQRKSGWRQLVLDEVGSGLEIDWKRFGWGWDRLG
jgi:hypothetical protein